MKDEINPLAAVLFGAFVLVHIVAVVAVVIQVWPYIDWGW